MMTSARLLIRGEKADSFNQTRHPARKPFVSRKRCRENEVMDDGTRATVK